jgi:RNA polymerase sigma-70 factor (ECF subfamily)
MAGLDETAWIEHYRALEKPLYNVVYRYLWDRMESQDVVQDAFLRCWRRRDRIKADGFKALIYRTAINLALNRRRRNKLWRLVSFETLPPEMLGTGATREPLSRSLEQAVDRLPERLKRVLLLSELAGMSYREIAEITGTKEGTVGSRRNRALAILRRAVEAPQATTR